jgi:transcriptional regulator with XRE-family HTH domain
MSKNNITKKIQQAVKETGLTQTAFAKTFGIGESIISKWLSGTRNPSISSLKTIAKATNKPLNYFLDSNPVIMNSCTKSTTTQNIARKIQQAVKEAGLTQQQFAKAFGIGETMISQWLAGSKNPTLTTLQKIAKATNKPLSFFVDNSGNVGNVSGSNNIIGKNQVSNLEAFEVAQKYIKKLEEEIELLKKDKK